MNDEKADKLLLAIESFIDGTDRSLKAANEIEGLMAEIFPDDERFEDTMIALASYRPGGGDYLYDDKQMTSVLINTKKLLTDHQK